VDNNFTVNQILIEKKMAEGFNISTGKAWGCSNGGGWVPYPRKIPRRHPLLDAVGRIDDPCAPCPANNPPSYDPTPKYKPPREGYPNNMCNLDDFRDAKMEAESGNPPGAVTNINIAPGTPGEITLCVRPTFQTETIMADPPTIQNCCDDARELDTLKDEVYKVIGPHEELEIGMKNWAKCVSPCGARLRRYPCRGVIRSPRPEWTKMNREELCKPSAVSTTQPDPEDSIPITGREFVEGKRTCDLYPIHPKLPPRFNNSEWFKGYGCEKFPHPFYITTAMDYGRFPPTAHTMTQSYYPIECKFTDHLAVTGMPRNRSLNLTSNKSCVC